MQNRTIAFVIVLLLVAMGLACSRMSSAGERWHLTLEVDPATPNLDAVVQETIKVIDTRLDSAGAKASVTTESRNRFRIELPKPSDPERLKKLILTEGTLELLHVISEPSPAACTVYSTQEDATTSLGGSVPPNRKVLPYRVGTAATPQNWIVAETPPIIDGRDLRNATAIPGDPDDEYSIAFTLNKDGAEKMGTWTKNNINQYVAVALNREVRSTAYIKSQIYDSGQITGRFSKESAEDLALTLRSGPLPAMVKIVEEKSN